MRVFVILRKVITMAIWLFLLIFGVFGYTFYKGSFFGYGLSVLFVSVIPVCALLLFRFKFKAIRIVKVLILALFITSFLAQYKFFNNPECPGEIPSEVTAVFSTGECAETSRINKDVCELASANPFDVLVSEKLLFVTHGKNESVTVHNYPVDRENKFNFKVISAGFRSRPQRMVMDDEGQNVYITNYGKKRDLIHVDLTNAKKEFINIYGCESSIDVAIDNKKKRLWILCEGSRTIIVFDLVRKKIIKKMFTLDLGFTVGLPYSVAINEKARKIYVTHWVGTRLLQIDADTFKLIKKKRIGFSAFKVLVDEKNDLIYVARPLGSEVVVLDGGDLSIVNRFDFGKGIRDIELIEERGLLVGGGYVDGVFRIMNVNSGEVIKEYELGTLIRGTFYDKHNDVIWVASGCGIYSISLSLESFGSAAFSTRLRPPSLAR